VRLKAIRKHNRVNQRVEKCPKRVIVVGQVRCLLVQLFSVHVSVHLNVIESTNTTCRRIDEAHGVVD